MSSNNWLQRAGYFVSGAVALVNDPSAKGPAIWFLAWQGTENSLKALCAEHKIPYTHDLSLVLSHIKKNNLLNEENFSELLGAVQVVALSGNYNDLRYPTNDFRFFENITSEELKKRVVAAKTVYEICSNNL